MAVAGRNEREPELIRRAEALEELASLPALFPLLRPQNRAFEEWLAEQGPEEPSEELTDEGIKWVARHERKRISRAHAQDYPLVWQSLVADVGDERRAGEEVVAGAVLAGLSERRELRARALELIEDSAEFREPLAALALVVRGTQLWSAAEAAEADYRVARIPDRLDEDAYEQRWDETFRRETARNWSDAHERRLFILVGRVRAQLPAAGYPRASAVLRDGCAIFERDGAFRRRLAARLLAYTLEPLKSLDSDSSLAA